MMNESIGDYNENPFKNQQGQVRWGYKFFSLILIWDMVIPVIILGIALAFTLAFRILLMNMGIMDGDGVLMESYRGQRTIGIWLS